MSISSQLPPIPLAQAGADLRALARSAGQNVEARVLSQTPGGPTQVMIGRQTIALQLPAPQPPGTTLTLAVQQAEGQLTLALVAVRPPAIPGTASPSPPAGATTVQLSAAALSAPNVLPAAIGVVSPSLAVPRGTSTSSVAAVSVSLASTPATVAASITTVVAPQASATGPQAPATAVQSPLPMANGQPAPAIAPTSGSAPLASAAPVQGPAGVGSVTNAAPIAAAPDVAGAIARPVVPYATAPNTVPAAAQPSATALSQPVQQASAVTLVGQHAPAPGGPGVPQGAQPIPNAASGSQAVLNQMVHSAAPRQDSVLGLTAAITAVAGKVALPEPVAKAMQQVLAQRLQLAGGRLDGTTLQAAVQRSGIFQEALMASGHAKGAAGDMKTSLLGLQRQLLSWLGNQAPVEQVSSVPPPVRGQVPRAKANSAAPRIVPLDPQDAGKVLLERTEAALSRLRLHQNASLPEPSTRSDGTQWSLDLPVVLGGQQALLQMQIHRDADQDTTRPEDRGWQVRFAINLDEAGEVGAQISMRGAATGVLLWADRTEVADMLTSGLDGLRDELTALGLAPGSVIVRTGSPPQPNAAPSASGHFVDTNG